MPSNLTQETGGRLLRRGADGKTAVGVAFATRQQRRLPAVAGAAGSAGAADGRSAPSGVFDAVEGSGEALGAWLPVLLLVIALGGLLAAARRRLGRANPA